MDYPYCCDSTSHPDVHHPDCPRGPGYADRARLHENPVSTPTPPLPVEQVKALQDWARRHQAWFWHNLLQAIRSASSHDVLSIEAEDCVSAILGAIRLVGPTPLDEVPWPLSAGGVYAAILAVAEVPMPEVDWDELSEVMAVHSGSRVSHAVAHSALCAAIADRARSLLDEA